MLCKKQYTQPFEIPGGTKGFLYPSSEKRDQTIALVEMDGVYPEDGYSYNDFCTETFFVVEGEIEIEVEGKKTVLGKEDLFFVYPKQKYRVEGKGKIVDFISPAWDKKQNHIIKSDKE